MMKRILKVVLVIGVIFSLTACSSKHEDNVIHVEVNEIQPENHTIEQSENVTELLGTENSIENVSEPEDIFVANEETVPESKTVWISASGVNFRRSPDMNGEIICQFERAAEVIRLDENGEWVHVMCGNEQGYIHEDYVSEYPPLNSATGEVYIIVKKEERLLELWQGETLVDSFPIGLGWNPEGHKQIEGDGKTPEGEYYVCVRNSNSSFYLSLGVSYPNKDDATAALEDGRIDRETYNRIVKAIENGECPDWYTPLGGEIMIHGCGGDSDWTAGCVAVDNEVMDILFEYCTVGTRITILP